MLQTLKLDGTLQRSDSQHKETVIVYNRGLISSCLGAQILRDGMTNNAARGVINLVPYFTHVRETKERLFEPSLHNTLTDVYLVGIEGWDESLFSWVKNESILSLTIFPISLAAAHAFFIRIKEARERNEIGAGVSITLIFDQQDQCRASLPRTVEYWLRDVGIQIKDEQAAQVAIDGYDRLCDGKIQHNTQASEESECADVFFRQCIQTTFVRKTEDYQDGLLANNEQMEAFTALMSGGFPAWVAGGRALIEKAREYLQGNLLMSEITPAGVVFAPNNKNEYHNLGFLLRQKYAACRAIVLYHELPKTAQYVYRILRGRVPSGNVFSILANVLPEGRPQSMVCTGLALDSVKKIANGAMADLVAQSSSRRFNNH